MSSFLFEIIIKISTFTSKSETKNSGFLRTFPLTIRYLSKYFIKKFFYHPRIFKTFDRRAKYNANAFV